MAAASLVVTLAWEGLANEQVPEAAAELDYERLRRARLMDDLMTGRGSIGGAFTLHDTEGARRSLADFEGRLVLVYFGFTFCPDVCPTDLFEIARALRMLEDSEQHVQPLYVTVDPERDTPVALGRYLAHFHPRLIGLTGSVEEIREVATRYKAYFQKVTRPRVAGYTVDHSANIYLVDQSGRFAGSLPPGTKAERLADVLRERLGWPADASGQSGVSRP